MKKKIFSISASLLLLTMLVIPADATNVDVTDPDAMLPVDIILDQDNREIRKVYDLSPNTDPSTLPMQQFERDGLLYECTDVLREVIIGSETQVITQTETVESDKKDMETILSLLPQEKEVTTEEDFSGTLHLDLDSIKTEPAGYGSSTKPVTATRTIQTWQAKISTTCQRALRRGAERSICKMSNGKRITPITPTTMRSATALLRFVPMAAAKQSVM